jgi:hypothetical protein
LSPKKVVTNVKTDDTDAEQMRNEQVFKHSMMRVATTIKDYEEKIRKTGDEINDLTETHGIQIFERNLYAISKLHDITKYRNIYRIISKIYENMNISNYEALYEVYYVTINPTM